MGRVCKSHKRRDCNSCRDAQRSSGGLESTYWTIVNDSFGTTTYGWNSGSSGSSDSGTSYDSGGSGSCASGE